MVVENARVYAVFCLLVSWIPLGAALGQVEPANEWSVALEEAKDGHLWRVGAWGVANAGLGLALVASSSRADQPARFGFGVQSAAWGVINLGIAGIGLSTGGADVAETLLDAAWAEDAYRDILLVNLGLNAGYMMVGGAMVIASHQGVRHAESWRGHGWAVVLQGLGLMILDGYAFWDAGRRLDAMKNQLEMQLSVAPVQDGLLFSIVVPF